MIDTHANILYDLRSGEYREEIERDESGNEERESRRRRRRRDRRDEIERDAYTLSTSLSST